MSQFSLPLCLEDDANCTQWRNSVLALSRSLSLAATQRPDLAAILMEAFDSALEQLLLFGSEDDLHSLETWLAEKSA